MFSAKNDGNGDDGMRYPKDLIEEKNKKTKMKRSIVKFWNVLYGQPEVVGAADAQKTQEAPETQEKIEEILQEKETNLQKLIAREKRGAGHEAAEEAKAAEADEAEKAADEAGAAEADEAIEEAETAEEAAETEAAENP